MEKGNIICNEVNLVGTLRTLTNEARILSKKRIKEIRTHVGEAFNSSIIIDIKECIPPLINDAELVNKIIKNGVGLLGNDKVIIKDKSSLEAEDFAYFLQKTKDAFFNIGCVNDSINSPIHTSTFNIDENYLLTCVLLQLKNIFMFQ